ncbi:MAG: PEP-CTERM sorting domain-containing protein [Burkholderiales bacterium]|nr:PEP-CTERM sorting domain-containing protein [Burkholderiales bacterium]
MKPIRSALIAGAMLACVPGERAEALILSVPVDTSFVTTTSSPGAQYDFASVTTYINPGLTSWIAWNNAPTLAFANPGCTGGFCLGPGGFGTDDFIRITVTNPSSVSQTVDLDQNTAFGNSFGQQNVVFGAAATAPDAIRTSPSFGSPPSTTTIFNEAGAFNGVFTTAGMYRFDFSFRNAFTNSGGHQNIYLLSDQNGVYGTPGPSVPIGGAGLTVNLDAGEIVANPVLADSCADMTPAGAALGLNAQSLGHLPRDTKTCTVSRSFIFSPSSTGPTLAHIYGNLEGRLIADNQGDASVAADVLLFDRDHVLIGESHYGKSAGSNLRQLVDWSIYENLAIDAVLNPGALYELTTRLHVSAFGGALGAGRSLFDETLELLISGEPENPFFDAQRMTTVRVVDLSNAVPEPATVALALLGLAGLGRFRGRSD